MKHIKFFIIMSDILQVLCVFGVIVGIVYLSTGNKDLTFSSIALIIGCVIFFLFLIAINMLLRDICNTFEKQVELNKKMQDKIKKLEKVCRCSHSKFESQNQNQNDYN